MTKAQRLLKLKALAKNRGGRCLTNSYVNARTRMLWQCENGHTWKTISDSVTRGSWCLICSRANVNKQKLAARIALVRKIARKKKGRCLTKTSVSPSIPVKMKCSKGHFWETKAQNLVDGKWCHTCSKNKKFTLEDIQKIARSHRGYLLSKSYHSIGAHLKWKCQKGHQWETSLASIRNGAWCPYCSGKARKNLSQCKALAKERGGECLSLTYENIKTKLNWRCRLGHEWSAKFGKILQGQWCRTCANKINADAKRSSISEMQKLAKRRGGRCLSKDYTNNQNPLIWECALGHQWQAKPGNIITGTWCPECSTYLSERICRAYFEALLKRKFPRSYPHWLRIKSGAKLELDGFSEKLGLAFEHHGEQHYTRGRLFSRTPKDLIRRKELDLLKKKLCKKNSVILIVIPALNTRLKIENLESFIRKKLAAQSISFSSKPVKINWSKVYLSEDVEKLAQMKKIAASRDGKLLTSIYSGRKNKYEWRCKFGHTWSATSGSVVSLKTWCPQCAGGKA